jgi:hypothetical protein
MVTQCTGKCCKTGLCKGFDSRQLISLLATAGSIPLVIDLFASGTHAGLNSINQLILMMVMSCFNFEVRTERLNIIKTSFGIKI